jgi:dTDP-glucose 4,6-dehydratase
MSAWNGTRVLVTGGGGFIGGHLVQTLVEAGADVRAFVRYNSRGERGSLERLDAAVLDAVEIHAGDIREYESAVKATEGREVVFHLAAYIAIPYSYADPRGFYETNVLGTLNVVQACRAAGAGRLVHTSTSEVYGTAQEVPITERHPISPQSPYAASKAAADQLVHSFHRSFGLPAVIVRPFNTYGPGQSARAVIPTIVSQALAGGTVKLGSLEPRRDLTFVGDTVAGFLASATAEAAVGETVQLGTGTDYSVAEIVAEVGSILGRELEVEHAPERVRPADSEVMRLISSPERMRELTGWEPKVSLREGLRETISWIDRHPDAYRAGEYAI